MYKFCLDSSSGNALLPLRPWTPPCCPLSRRPLSTPSAAHIFYMSIAAFPHCESSKKAGLADLAAQPFAWSRQVMSKVLSQSVTSDLRLSIFRLSGYIRISILDHLHHPFNRILDHAYAEGVPNSRISPLIHRDPRLLILIRGLLEPPCERLTAPRGYEFVFCAVAKKELLSLQTFKKDLPSLPFILVCCAGRARTR